MVENPDFKKAHPGLTVVYEEGEWIIYEFLGAYKVAHYCGTFWCIVYSGQDREEHHQPVFCDHCGITNEHLTVLARTLEL